MATPEAGRQLRQQRADIDSLYELVLTVDLKFDNLTDEVANVRHDIGNLRHEMTTGFTEVHSVLAQILERLDR